MDDSDGSSDCSDDSLSSDDIWEIHNYEHGPDNVVVVRGRDPMDMSDEEAEFNDGYVTTTF